MNRQIFINQFMLKSAFEILKYLKKKLIVNIYTNVYKRYRLFFTIA